MPDFTRVFIATSMACAVFAAPVFAEKLQTTNVLSRLEQCSDEWWKSKKCALGVGTPLYALLLKEMRQDHTAETAIHVLKAILGPAALPFLLAMDDQPEIKEI